MLTTDVSNKFNFLLNVYGFLIVRFLVAHITVSPIPVYSVVLDVENDHQYRKYFICDI